MGVILSIIPFLPPSLPLPPLNSKFLTRICLGTRAPRAPILLADDFSGTAAVRACLLHLLDHSWCDLS